LNKKSGNAGAGGNWETRWHPLLEQWVIIAANTEARPWSGNVSQPPLEHQRLKQAAMRCSSVLLQRADAGFYVGQRNIT